MGIKRDKLKRSLGGISEMNGLPQLIFVIDTNYEMLAINEAIKLKIPVVAILDTNSNPEGIEYPIPGNDDARRSIILYCQLIKEAILSARDNIKDNNSEKFENNKKAETEKKDPPKVLSKIKDK